MRSLLLFGALLPVCAFAQSPTDVFDKAPPQIDSALRARVAKFFQAHVDGKFRQAEEVVAEESRDAFYNSEKQRYLSFEIVRINYSDNFKKAEVVTATEVDWYNPRMGKVRVKPPLTSSWEYKDGQWWWYMAERKDWQTPFGLMRPGPEGTGASAPVKIVIPDAKDLLDKVKVSKLDIKLSGFVNSEDSAEITNGMPGDLTLRMEDPGVTGLSVTIDKPVLHANETARISFKYEPPDRAVKINRYVRVDASPTGQYWIFNLTFGVPPEFEKYIPKDKPGK